MKLVLPDNVFKQLLEHFNHSWTGYRRVRKGVKKRIRREMTRLGVTTVAQYIAILEKSEAEMALFQTGMGVTISRFFRDQAVWEYLYHKILPQMLLVNQRGLRIWTIGCACGEEAYTISILLDMLDMRERVKITATDFNTENLHRAKMGKYNKSSVKEVPEKIVEKYFNKIPKGKYAVANLLGEYIHWQKHDLFTEPPAGPFHLIFLRNSLLTYHQGQHMEDALQAIVNTMGPGGCLIVGAKEKIESHLGLVADKTCRQIYQRTDG